MSDTGEGITAEAMKKIFDPYFSTKKVGQGTGLGLSVVHGIVSQLGGAVYVESEPEKGTSLSVFLPSVSEELVERPDKMGDTVAMEGQAISSMSITRNPLLSLVRRASNLTDTR